MLTKANPTKSIEIMPPYFPITKLYAIASVLYFFFFTQNEYAILREATVQH